MKQITLEIEDNKFETLIKFLKTLDYVKVTKGDFTIKDLQSSLVQVKKMQSGKLPKKSIEKLLNGVQD
jgi:hypothetical protein